MSIRVVTCVALGWLALIVCKQASAWPPVAPACGMEQKKGDVAAASAAYGRAWVYSNARRYEEAIGCFRVSMAIQSQLLGPFAQQTKDSVIGVAMALRMSKRDWEAEQFIKKRLGMESAKLETWKMHVELWHYLGYVVGLQGRYRDQEASYLKALAISRQFDSIDQVDTTSSIEMLAEYYEGRGERDKAITRTIESLRIQEEHGVPNSKQYIRRLLHLASLYGSDGNSPNLSEAEAVLLKALHFSDKRFAKSDQDLSQIYMALSEHYKIRGLPEKAMYYAQQELLAIEAAEGPDSANLAGALSRAVQLHAANKKFDVAINLERRACTLTAKNLTYLPVVASCWSNLADLLADNNRWPEAYATAKNAAAMSRRHELSALRSDNQDAKVLKTSPGIFNYTFLSQIHKGWAVYHHGAIGDVGLAGETFEAAQWATRTRAADALNHTTARLAAAAPGLGELARQIETINAAKDVAERTLVDELNKSERDASKIATLRKKVISQQADLDRFALDMVKRFPAYAVLSNPAPLSVKALQSVLMPDEVLVLFLVMDGRDTGRLKADTFAWFVSKSDTRWVKIGLDAAAVQERVSTLRCGLDPSEWLKNDADHRWIARRNTCKSLESARNATKMLPFRIDTAFELYEALFGQAIDVVKGKKLLVVPSGPLSSLPFHVLVTTKPKLVEAVSPSDLRQTDWLVRSQTVTVLPSVASLGSVDNQNHASQMTAAARATKEAKRSASLS